MRKTPLESWVARKIGASGPLTSEKLAAYQLEKLREIFHWARLNSIFYARHFASYGEETISSFQAFSRLPFTSAEDLRTNDLQFLCGSQDQISRVVTLHSSGTSGPAKRLYFSQDDQELTLDFFLHGMSTFVSAGDKVFICLPGERPGSVGDLLAVALGRLGVVPIIWGLVRDPVAALSALQEHQATCIVGFPVHILALARTTTDSAFPLPDLRTVLFCSDHVPDSIVAAVKAAWHCDVFEHYGMTEMGLGGGVDCEAHCGYHMREADLYVEVIDPANGECVPAGQSGEIVFTTLTRRAMPLIRYRTGDMSRLLVDPCPCGSLLRRLERVRTRVSGRITLPGGSELTMASLDEALFQIPQLQEFNVVVSRTEPCTLTLELNVPTDVRAGVLGAARKKLQDIPGLCSEVQSRNLDICLRFDDKPFRTSVDKRTIHEWSLP
jgi:phenylacetate-coenzyme A ligase PaaK-like adenylate-forming protein